ncbi:PLDc_N domain-containing protein [Nocardiopsis sp. HNM0947]|uniref:PLDc_N domain-containing protein n=1 Tax=Nocardiopsis coralli TaxID=2772213 RepID=A0ABR9P7H9_9ACTN|nr:PLD nuclease N-terminal domain-containing protein [Nocardiopsis coralli]MBE2999797.1 PLDc_N domain-containing protein [Nocardiopsis coralli]
MVYLALFLAVMSLAIWVYALFDVISADAGSTRLLSKPVWVVIVLFLPKFGGLLWFTLGRPPRESLVTTRSPATTSPFPEYDHPNRARGATPEDDEEFLRRCRERAEAQRRRARELQEREEQERRERQDREQDEDGLDAG